MGLSDKTVRGYLDILTGTYMVRQLQPWYENVGKRQVKAPKIYLRDTGILHSLLALPDHHGLSAHPRVGASWEGFAIEQAIQLVQPSESYFWATYQGAEIDLLFLQRGHRFGIEVKYSESPKMTESARTACEDLQLRHLWMVYPGDHLYPIGDDITVIQISEIVQLPERIRQFA